MNTTESKLFSLIATTLEIPVNQVSMSLKIGDTQSWDSVGHLGLMTAIEGDFGISFEMEEMAELTSVEEILGSIRAKSK